MRPRNLSPRALRDIEQAVDDIAASAAGPTFADRFAVAVAEAAEQVARRPLIGHRRLELLPSRFRFWATKGFDYLLVYDAEHPERTGAAARAAFRQRAGHAIDQIARAAPIPALTDALAAPTDFGAVARALRDPVAFQAALPLDPLADALARGVILENFWRPRRWACSQPKTSDARSAGSRARLPISAGGRISYSA